jgi:hypothetical protein
LKRSTTCTSPFDSELISSRSSTMMAVMDRAAAQVA